MASSYSPAGGTFGPKALLPEIVKDGPFFRALAVLDDYARNNISLGPAMPEAETLRSAARAAGITPKQALTAYLSILDNG